MTRKVCQSWTI